MGEQNSPKNSNLMIFMRTLLTDGVRVCQVKAYRTELATTCLCMALTGIHDSVTHWTSTLDIANEIHDLIMMGQMLRARFNFSLPATSELLVSPLPTKHAGGPHTLWRNGQP